VLFAISQIIVYCFVESLFQVCHGSSLEIDEAVDALDFSEEYVIFFAIGDGADKTVVFHYIHGSVILKV
jgi:hypothetical protein